MRLKLAALYRALPKAPAAVQRARAGVCGVCPGLVVYEWQALTAAQRIGIGFLEGKKPRFGVCGAIERPRLGEEVPVAERVCGCGVLAEVVGGSDGATERAGGRSDEGEGVVHITIDGRAFGAAMKATCDGEALVAAGFQRCPRGKWAE